MTVTYLIDWRKRHQCPLCGSRNLWRRQREPSSIVEYDCRMVCLNCGAHVSEPEVRTT